MTGALIKGVHTYATKLLYDLVFPEAILFDIHLNFVGCHINAGTFSDINF